MLTFVTYLSLLAEELKANDAIYWFGRGGRFVYAAFNDTDVDMAWVPTYDFLETPEASNADKCVYSTLQGQLREMYVS